MGNDQYYDGDEEREAAEDRLRQIRGGGQAPDDDANLGDFESSASSRVRSRAKSALGQAQTGETRVSQGGRRSSANQALMVVGSFVAVGILIVIVIALLGALRGDGGGLQLFATKTPTATATPEATSTPLPTETPTPTREAPNLALPPLTCLFQSGTGCFDYCGDPTNKTECDSAKNFIAAQGADPEMWLTCIASGPGANTGNPQDCLEDAWRSKNP